MVFSLFFSVLVIQITKRGSNFNDMQPRFTLANQGIEKFLENKKKNGHSDSSAIYPSLHDRYIACVYPKCCDYKGGNFFLEELSVLKRETCFCLLFTVCNFMFIVQLNFVGQSVLYSTAYLSDRHQNYLT